VALKTICTREI